MGIHTLGPNGDALEDLFEQFVKDPNSVDVSWRTYFATLDSAQKVSVPKESVDLDLKVAYLISSYRTYGHFMARINPIDSEEKQIPWQLQLERFGFSSGNLDEVVPTNGLLEKQQAPLKEVVEVLQKIYCGPIGVEFRGVQNPELEEWLQEQIEPTRFSISLTIEQKKMILQYLNRSELFEIFLHTKYTGQKRFSLEGGEVLIPIMEGMIDKGAELGAERFVLGMAHRGRLNVLSNIMEKSYSDIFSEFEEGYIPMSFEGTGDVKYHKGFTSTVKTYTDRRVQVDLAPNPSHLEAVDPVVEGEAYALQQQQYNRDNKKVVPILVHGDAAIAGQGVVYETMQLYNLDGYGTGGTLHIVINNQIGFTTLPQDGRSTRYCTDIAKAFSAPVFHVNAENPEACLMATYLAMQLRQNFHCDVFIDVYCWRKFGHNEADEPAFTQPLEYQKIRKKKSIREQYRDDLIHQGVLEREMAETLEKEFKDSLQKALTEIKISQKDVLEPEPVTKENVFAPFKSGVSLEKIKEISEKALAVPEGFVLHKKLERLLKERGEMAAGQKPIDWGMGEMLAFATLLWDGKAIRLTGQDTRRGTFSHRHAIWMDQNDGKSYFPLQNLKEEQGNFEVINSPLSENAALGFEYGYTIQAPKVFVLWEAQFGDFVNSAQVVLDQFITTGEQKWNQKSGLTLLLPHGYEGQGPEHSSARMERFLTLCGDDNLLVANPSTPAQLFHLLRRQALWNIKRPLIVFTPKGLLRHPDCVSSLDDLVSGSFSEIIDDPKADRKADRLIFCSGHIYYDLLSWRNDNTPIIRIEQLYPLHETVLQEIFAQYPAAKEVIWAQEEPKNMGAYGTLGGGIARALGQKLCYVGRPRSAAPASGSYGLHKEELENIRKKLFG